MNTSTSITWIYWRPIITNSTEDKAFIERNMFFVYAYGSYAIVDAKGVASNHGANKGALVLELP